MQHGSSGGMSADKGRVSQWRMVMWRRTWKFRPRSGSLRQAANDEALIQPREKEMSVAWHGHLVVARCQALWRLMHQSDERCPAAVPRVNEKEHGRRERGRPSARDTWISSILQRRSTKKLSFITTRSARSRGPWRNHVAAAFAFSPSFKILESISRP